MKHMRKFACLLLALIMVFALATTAFATDVTITAPAGSTRTYEVYQIFTGDLANNVLSNVKWGKNGTGNEGDTVPQETLDALVAVNSKSDTDKLAEITRYVNLDSDKFGIVKDGSPLSAPTGYYLIKDNGPVGEGEAYSLYVVQVVGPTTIEPKVSKVTSEKKVDDKNDSNSTQDKVKWEDSADYDIGDDVPFLLKATIANDYDNYKVYKLTFHDQESNGLTFQPETVVVKIDGYVVNSKDYTVTSPASDGHTFDISFTDLKTVVAADNHKAGPKSVITVEYSSILNDNAVLGSTGNPNTMHITYSNNPNDEQGGEKGKTPDDKVIVFTFQTIVNKVTKNPDYDPKTEGSKEYIPLKGAEFTLEKFEAKEGGTVTYKDVAGEWVAKTLTKGVDEVTFTSVGLDDGEYRIHESKTPDGYNTIEDVYFTITASHDAESDTPALTGLNGNVTNGLVTFTCTPADGTLSTNVVNNSGTELPSTGGVGTTIFYALGSILVIGAAVLLVTRKRMSVDA